MMKPTWVDRVIDSVIESNDPLKIAQAVANSPQFVNAIKEGLANPPRPGVMGPSHSQIIRQNLQEALAAD